MPIQQWTETLIEALIEKAEDAGSTKETQPVEPDDINERCSLLGQSPIEWAILEDNFYVEDLKELGATVSGAFPLSLLAKEDLSLEDKVEKLKLCFDSDKALFMFLLSEVAYNPAMDAALKESALSVANELDSHNIQYDELKEVLALLKTPDLDKRKALIKTLCNYYESARLHNCQSHQLTELVLLLLSLEKPLDLTGLIHIISSEQTDQTETAQLIMAVVSSSSLSLDEKKELVLAVQDSNVTITAQVLMDCGCTQADLASYLPLVDKSDIRYFLSQGSWSENANLFKLAERMLDFSSLASAEHVLLYTVMYESLLESETGISSAVDLAVLSGADELKNLIDTAIHNQDISFSFILSLSRETFPGELSMTPEGCSITFNVPYMYSAFTELLSELKTLYPNMMVYLNDLSASDDERETFRVVDETRHLMEEGTGLHAYAQSHLQASSAVPSDESMATTIQYYTQYSPPARADGVVMDELSMSQVLLTQSAQAIQSQIDERSLTGYLQKRGLLVADFEPTLESAIMSGDEELVERLKDEGHTVSERFIEMIISDGDIKEKVHKLRSCFVNYQSFTQYLVENYLTVFSDLDTDKQDITMKCLFRIISEIDIEHLSTVVGMLVTNQEMQEQIKRNPYFADRIIKGIKDRCPESTVNQLTTALDMLLQNKEYLGEATVDYFTIKRMIDAFGSLTENAQDSVQLLKWLLEQQQLSLDEKMKFAQNIVGKSELKCLSQFLIDSLSKEQLFGMLEILPMSFLKEMMQRLRDSGQEGLALGLEIQKAELIGYQHALAVAASIVASKSDRYDERGLSADGVVLQNVNQLYDLLEAAHKQENARHRFVVEGAHWYCGEIVVKDSVVEIAICDSVPHQYWEGMVEDLEETYPKMAIYLNADNLQEDYRHCKAFALDNFRRIMRLEAGLVEHAKQSGAQPLDKDDVGGNKHYYALPDTFLLGSQAERFRVKQNKVREGRDLTQSIVNRKGNTYQEVLDKTANIDESGDSHRIEYKLGRMSRRAISFQEPYAKDPGGLAELCNQHSLAGYAARHGLTLPKAAANASSAAQIEAESTETPSAVLVKPLAEPSTENQELQDKRGERPSTKPGARH